MTEENYTFNNDNGVAKSSDIESDKTTRNPQEEESDEWNPEVESWDEYKNRT